MHLLPALTDPYLQVVAVCHSALLFPKTGYWGNGLWWSLLWTSIISTCPTLWEWCLTFPSKNLSVG
uniref:Putative ovule protein n=1 Tax=Solanum chacoense TaxID=4108 RepID=A0A0V0GR42_SOLCH